MNIVLCRRGNAFSPRGDVRPSRIVQELAGTPASLLSQRLDDLGRNNNNGNNNGQTPRSERCAPAYWLLKMGDAARNAHLIRHRE